MEIKLDKSNPIPISVQVKEQIKMFINSGTYKEGDKLPSINQLAALLEVNKNTIVTVLKDLHNEGYLNSQRGKGIYINKRVENRRIESSFLFSVDCMIRDAVNQGLGVNELINLISARFNHVPPIKKAKVVFVMGMSQELVDINVKKLKERVPEVDFEGLFLSNKLTKENFQGITESADVIIVPVMIYDFIKERLPKDKPVIKTIANLKLLDSLKKGVEKKSKVAVIGVNPSGSQTLANMFVSAGLFKPKLVLSLDNLDKCKKELKDIDSIVVCISAKSAVEKLKLKDKNIYYFSDYIDDQSFEEIKIFIDNL